MMMQKTTVPVSFIIIMDFLFCLSAISAGSPLSASAAELPGGKGPQMISGPSIPWTGLGEKALEQFGGKGRRITPTDRGVKLECLLQRLEGEVTPDGMTMLSTTKSGAGDQFTMKASGMGRENSLVKLFSENGTITGDDTTVRWVRPDIVEEYSVSGDGIRQDFVLLSRPEGAGPLLLNVVLSGATAAKVPEGAALTLTGSSRKLAYADLHVTDAGGHELQARFRIAGVEASEISIEVDDAQAVYPIRIDPTITDDDWVSMNQEILGTDGNGDRIYAIAIHGGDLYVGGEFAIAGGVMANSIAKWDGVEWSALGSGIDGRVDVLAVDSAGNLYAGGSFLSAGGASANRIAKWDGKTWSALGSGLGGWVTEVHALAVDGADNLYAGGWFETAGGIAAKNIAKWDGAAWNAIGSGTYGRYLEGAVRTLVLDESGNLYAGGHFLSAGEASANYIAKWNGSTWSALGSGLDGNFYPEVHALAVDSRGVLYAGGRFDTAGGVPAKNIAKWDGATWSALDNGLDKGDDEDSVDALAVDARGDLYAVENLYSVDWTSYIAKWNGSNWNALERKTFGKVRSLAADGSGNLYAGGDFDAIGDVQAENIAKWDGSTWSALDSGMSTASGVDGEIRAFAVEGKNLYAGGNFFFAGSVLVKHIAKWDGTEWSALGSGIEGPLQTIYETVMALALDGAGNLYAGGEFGTAGGISAKNIAKWDGTGWSALGSGIDADQMYHYPGVSAIVVDGRGDLYAGGRFQIVGGVAAKSIAKWDGASWSALGGGIEGSVNVLAVDGAGNLYAGGDFNTAGGVAANHIAKWDGTEWSALGSGLVDTEPLGYTSVEVLAVDAGGDLYVSGHFNTAGGVAVSNIAKWDGSTWSALGEGMSGVVRAFAKDSAGNLYAQGDFTTADGTLTNCILKWDGSVWSVLGSGTGHYTYALAVDDANTLYAGGNFFTAGNKFSPYIAQCRIPYTIKFQAEGASLTGNTSQLIYHGESGTPVTAIAPAGYVFLKWTLDGAEYSTANPLRVTNATRDMSLIATAVFGYGLTYTAGAGGTVSGASPQTVAQGTSGTAVTAIPDPGYCFVQWSDGVADNPRTDSQVTSDITVTAQFEKSEKSDGGGCFVDVLMR